MNLVGDTNIWWGTQTFGGGHKPRGLLVPFMYFPHSPLTIVVGKAALVTDVATFEVFTGLQPAKF